MQTEHKQEERAKRQGTSEKGKASTWKTRRTWEGCLEEVEWEGSLKGKCRAYPQARLCCFLLGILGSDWKNRNTRTKFGVMGQGAHCLPHSAPYWLCGTELLPR